MIFFISTGLAAVLVQYEFPTSIGTLSVKQEEEVDTRIIAKIVKNL